MIVNVAELYNDCVWDMDCRVRVLSDWSPWNVLSRNSNGGNARRGWEDVDCMSLLRLWGVYVGHPTDLL